MDPAIHAITRRRTKRTCVIIYSVIAMPVGSSSFRSSLIAAGGRLRGLHQPCPHPRKSGHNMSMYQARRRRRGDRCSASISNLFAFDTNESGFRNPWILPSRSGSVLSCSLVPQSGIDATTNARDLLCQQVYPGISIHDALLSSLRILEGHDIPEPDESVLHLLSHALNLNWDNGHRHLREVLTLPYPLPSPGNPSTSRDETILNLAKRTLSSEQSNAYQSLLERRLQFEPLQFIVGQWDFHDLSGLKIRRPMLCPRPETEELVELVLADIDRLIHDVQIEAGGNNRKIRILDVGCGTGAIGIAIARRYPKHVQIIALDVSPEAVELSNENAGIFLSGSTGDIGDEHVEVSSLYRAILCSARDFTNDEPCERKWEMDFDIVVSNPPYIPTKDMQGLSRDVTGFESHEALCGGDDGLDVIRDIVRRLPEWLSPTVASDDRRHLHRHCWMEVDDSHPTKLEQLLAPGSKESILRGVEYCDGRKDFCGRDRFVKIVQR
jgi:release factor glutamine methyltransferase